MRHSLIGACLIALTLTLGCTTFQDQGHINPISLSLTSLAVQEAIYNPLKKEDFDVAKARAMVQRLDNLLRADHTFNWEAAYTLVREEVPLRFQAIALVVLNTGRPDIDRLLQEDQVALAIQVLDAVLIGAQTGLSLVEQYQREHTG
jgi:hypothetical protein